MGSQYDSLQKKSRETQCMVFSYSIFSKMDLQTVPKIFFEADSRNGGEKDTVHIKLLNFSKNIIICDTYKALVVHEPDPENLHIITT